MIGLRRGSHTQLGQLFFISKQFPSSSFDWCKGRMLNQLFMGKCNEEFRAIKLF